MPNNNQLNVKLANSFKVCSNNNIEDLSILSIISFILKHYNTHTTQISIYYCSQ